jgi:hypothetical protein
LLCHRHLPQRRLLLRRLLLLPLQACLLLLLHLAGC